MRAVLLASLLFPPLLQAQNLSEAVSNCRKVNDSLERLICYDKLARTLDGYSDSQLPERSARPVLPATPPPGAAAPAVANSDPVKQEFGLGQQTLKESTSDKVYFVLAERTETPTGKVRFIMQNGQIWEQTDKKYSPFNAGDTLYINKGLLGAFYLSSEDSNRSVKVKRVDAASLPRAASVDVRQAEKVTEPRASTVATSGQDEVKDTFGLSKAKLAGDTPEKVYYVLAQKKENKSGKVRFTMENGQVWQQTEKKHTPFKTGDQVYVKAGLLGAFYLSSDDSKRSTRVKRIK